ncbi:ricin-type beta-trefoil lectin domain protein [Streptomyces sp. NPDC014684]|uniref:RICIN domain-containing protein n=1 Tax=Streptomyces sp. NPDC014684 TaxID=3364880 RepID=UPI0036FAA90A
MPTPHPPRPPYPPPGGGPGESDEFLAAPLRAGSDAEASRSTALLMARHWAAAQDYAVVCLATAGPLAHMVTGAAFHRTLTRLALGEPAEALRPRLLVAVRDTVLNWSATDRTAAVLPALRKPAGGRGMRNAKTLIPENRVLSERAFHSLPRLEQTLLWHTEVEAEPVHLPAALLGLDADSAAAALEQARDRFREGCVRAHRELAPSTECRHYNRLLDAPIRRGGALLPDVRQHLDDCAYCRHAAEQLGRIEGGLGVLLAEAVLGWGARRYLESRPGRSGPARARAAAPEPGGRGRGGGRRTGVPARAPGGRRRRGRAAGPFGSVLASAAGWQTRTLLLGAGIAAAALLTTVVALSALSDGGDGADPVASDAAPGTGVRPPATSPGKAGLPTAGRPARLRNAATDLCLDVKGEVRAGASALLDACSSAPAQQWTYDADGLLRSAADPRLCLDSHADAGVVILGTCAGAGQRRGDDVRYELTVRGELLPRWDRTLALAPAGDRAGADVVVKVGDRSAAQRWRTDAPSASPGSLSVAGGDGPTASGAGPSAGRAPGPGRQAPARPARLPGTDARPFSPRHAPATPGPHGRT